MRHKDMEDRKKTKTALIEELTELRQQVTGLKAANHERRQTEEALKENQARFRELFDEAPVGYHEVDIEGRVTRVNRTELEMLGYTAEEMLGQPVWSFVVEEETSHQGVLAKLAGTRQPGRAFERTYRRKDGTSFPVLMEDKLLLDEKGRIAGMRATIQDVAVRKRTEEALRESQQLLERTFASLRDAVLIVAAETPKIIDCNTAASEIFGYGRDEILGKTAEFLHVDEAAHEEFRKHLRGAIDREGFLHQFEFKMKRKDGTTFPAEHSIMPLEDEKGQRMGYVSVLRDITDRKRMEEEIIKAQKLESLGSLARGIAHDFNNLLTTILGSISVAKAYSDPGDEIFNLLSDAENASKRASDLTKELLSFSKGGTPVKKVMSIGKLVKNRVLFALAGSNVDCEFDIPDDLWPVEVDMDQINQVIHNIVINAREAMPEGGTLHVIAGNVANGEKEEGSLKAGKYIKVSIKDQGLGIPREKLSKVFDPYFGTSGMRGGIGMGLGLAAGYSIVKGHGGLITVETKEGLGTTFNIYLPASRKAGPGEPSIGTAKILLMDDEGMVRKIAEALLKHIGYEVEVARDGSEAVEIFRKAKTSQQPFDAVILDLTVRGGMGGKETMGKLLEIDPKVKAILSSGYLNDPVLIEYERYGFKGFVSKPFTMDELRNAVKEMLSP